MLPSIAFEDQSKEVKKDPYINVHNMLQQWKIVIGKSNNVSQ
jgi:hypothetical protein